MTFTSLSDTLALLIVWGKYGRELSENATRLQLPCYDTFTLGPSLLFLFALSIMYPVWHGGRLIYQYFPQPYYPPGSAPSR